MTLNNVKKEIENINKWLFANTEKWFDFQFSHISLGMIKLEGSVDLTILHQNEDNWAKEDSIVIEFCDPTFIKTILYGWELQKEKPFIELLIQDASLEVLRKDGCTINEKDYVFKINTDRDEPVLVIAKGIKCTISKK